MMNDLSDIIFTLSLILGAAAELFIAPAILVIAITIYMRVRSKKNSQKGSGVGQLLTVAQGLLIVAFIGYVAFKFMAAIGAF